MEVTLRRTAAATALAARFLARPDARTVLICGCGEQGAAHLAALREVRPIERVHAWDLHPQRAEDFAQAARGDGFDAEAVADLAVAGPASDIIVTCSTATSPFLRAAFVRPGTFVAGIGADSPAKNELHPELFSRALVVADVRSQCETMGDLHHAVAAGTVAPGAAIRELAELVSGAWPGRSTPDRIILFDSTGTAAQDVAAAALIYGRALAAGTHGSVFLGR
jgi:ornithine cyclodeaminase/alanine dehydrogenase-like protein (mu-crystallin family)